MTVIIEDAFTGSSGTDLASHTISPTNTPGNSWVDNATNSLELDGSGSCIANSGTDTSQVDTGISNDLVAAYVDVNANGGDNRFSVFILADGNFASNQPNQGYKYNFRDIDQKLFEITGTGSSSEVASDTLSRNQSTTYEIRIEIDSTPDLKCSIDGTEQTGLTQSSITVHADLTGQQFAGITHEKFVSSGGTFNDFTVDNLTAAGGANPKGPLGMPLHGPFAGPVGP